MAVRIGRQGLHIRIAGQSCLIIGHILGDQVLQGQEVLQVVHDVHIAEGAAAEYDIRQFAAGQQNVLLLFPVGAGNGLPVDLHVGSGFQVDQPLILCEAVPHFAPAHGQHGEFHRLRAECSFTQRRDGGRQHRQQQENAYQVP
ncbi:hypothetical protein SDC9_177985 [bioreactor metagenome]|uniref:Uncharacterized protein n=1 Tax=bioreactor metagenome TaxID=1076179 RepID=A0A645H2E2_9ZZZZ